MNFKNKNVNRILFLSCLLVVLSLTTFIANTNQNSNYITNSTLTSLNQEKIENPSASELDYYSKQVINYGNFSDGWKPYWTNSSGGDSQNINASVIGTHANYEILGNKTTKKIDTSLNSGGWYRFKNGIFLLPDTSVINASGCYVKHVWDEGVNQTRNYPSVLWKKTVIMPVDMLDYNITSASLQVKINGSVDRNVDVRYDTIAKSGGTTGNFRFGIGDYAEFFVQISDIQGTSTYPVAYNRTSTLGRYNPPGTSTMPTKTMENIGTQKDLMNAISRSLENDEEHKRFNITLGITIYCEDNDYGTDIDTWRYLIINSFNLTFTYERLIDKDTSLSWSQKGDGIFGSNKVIVNATLNFDHKIDYNWLGNTSSSNSEIRIKVNNMQISETIKLSSINKTWQKAKSSGFIVTPFVLGKENTFINLSIQVYIGDTFNLDKKITVSIDNVSLIIWYSLYTAPYNTKYDLFLERQNKTLSRDIEISIGETVNITFMYKNDTSNNNFIPGATVTLKGSGIDTTLDQNGNQYNRTIDTDALGFGDKYLTIEASKRNYDTQEIQIKISIVPRYAYINKIYLDGTPTKTIDEIPSGHLLNVTITYIDNITKNLISNATVKLLNTTITMGKFNETTKYNHYNYTLNTTGFQQGVYYFTIYAEAGVNYTTDYEQIIVVILAKGTLYDLYLNRTKRDTIGVTINQFVYINFTFKDFDGYYIPGATVDINGSGISELLTDHGNTNYSTSVNTTKLNQGNNRLDIFAQSPGFISQSITLWIRVEQRPTIFKLYINGTYMPALPPDFIISAKDLAMYEWYNITVSYTDKSTGDHIHPATVSLNGTFISESFNYVGNNYSYRLNSTNEDLRWGVNYLTIIAEEEFYAPQTAILKITIISVETNYTLFLDGKRQQNSDPFKSITKPWNEKLNITVKFVDRNGHYIPSATVDINGTGISKLLKDNGYQYNITVNTTIFSVGFTYLTIVAYKTNFETQTIPFKVEVIDRTTDYRFLLNGADKTEDIIKSKTLQWNEILNITVRFLDLDGLLHIGGATVSINGTGGISMLLLPYGQQYNRTINTAAIGVGIKYITILAHKENYTTQTISFTIEVIDRTTDYRFLLNEEDKTEDIIKSKTLLWNEILNITVRFLDLDGLLHIEGATVDMNGTGGISMLLLPYGQQYNRTINTAAIGVGIKYMTILAHKENYTTQAISFTIEVIDRPTDYQISLNGVNSTSNPSIALSIGKLLEIKVKYIDNTTKNHIGEAMVNITGEGVLASLNESASLREYSITISSSDLDIGIRYLTVFAEKSNYVSKSIKITIEVKRIRTEISTVSGNLTINIRPGENANISIILKNLDFGGRIKGARVNYTWELGQGALYDLDNDGVYQIILENVPAGTYTLTITVYASDDYDFERFRITINAVRPEQEVFWIYVLAGTSIAAAIGSGTYLIAYQKVLKYPKSIRKLRKFRSKLKRSTITGVEIVNRESTITSLYQEELGKISKMIKGKPEEKPKEMPDKLLDQISEKPIEKTLEVKPDKTPDNPPNEI